MVKVGTLDEDQLNTIRQIIEKQGQIEGDLRKEISLNIKRLIEIQSTAVCVIAVLCRSRPAHAHQCPYPQGSA